MSTLETALLYTALVLAAVAFIGLVAHTSPNPRGFAHGRSAP